MKKFLTKPFHPHDANQGFALVLGVIALSLAILGVSFVMRKNNVKAFKIDSAISANEMAIRLNRDLRNATQTFLQSGTLIASAVGPPNRLNIQIAAAPIPNPFAAGQRYSFPLTTNDVEVRNVMVGPVTTTHPKVAGNSSIVQFLSPELGAILTAERAATIAMNTPATINDFTIKNRRIPGECFDGTAFDCSIESTVTLQNVTLDCSVAPAFMAITVLAYTKISRDGFDLAENNEKTTTRLTRNIACATATPLATAAYRIANNNLAAALPVACQFTAASLNCF